MPVVQSGDCELLAAGKIDLLGINYYQPRRVKARMTAINPDSPFLPDWFFENYEMPGRKMNPYRGWEIYERGIYDILINLRDNYGNIPSYISENGMGIEGEHRFIGEDGQVKTIIVSTSFAATSNGFIPPLPKEVIAVVITCGPLLTTGPG